MEGYFVIGYADGGDYPNRQIDLVPGAMEEADELLLQHEDTHARFGRVSRLIDGFESPAGMELLATVHWLVQYEGVADAHQAVAGTHAWNDGKKRFTHRQIRLTYDRLAECGWC